MKTTFRLLVFRASSEELRSLNLRHLAVGVMLTWLVGIGRWWEDPKANLLQHLGVGSVVYVFFLGFFLWLVLWPIAPRHWSLVNVIAFVSLTAPPAILYAIPVRHGLELHTAQAVRLWMLAIVAGWRVSLLIFYIRRIGFEGTRLAVAALFPITLIVFTLTALNLEKVVFEFMGGIRPENRSVNDTAYEVLTLISMFSVLAFLILTPMYLFASINSSFAKFGRRTGYITYPLGMICGIAGWFSDPYDPIPKYLLMGAGIILVLGTAFEMHLNKETDMADTKPQETDLEKTLRDALEQFRSETGTIHALDSKTQLLQLVAQVGLPPQMLEIVKTIPVGKGIAGQVVAQNKPVTICNLQTDTSGVAKPGAKQTGVGGALCVPIRRDGQLIGTLGIGTVRQYEYTAEETAGLEEIGRRIAESLK